MRDILILAGFVAMLPYVLRRPHIGALVWCWTALLVPNTFVYGFAGPIPFNFIIAVLTLLVIFLSKERFRFPVNPTILMIILLGLGATTSTTFGIGNAEIAWIEWEKFIKIIVFAVVVGAVINTRHRIQALMWVILLSLGFHGVLEGLKFLASGGGHHIYGPSGSVIGDNNHFALAILCTIPLVFYLYRESTHRIAKLFLLACGTVLFFTVVGTFSRGGFIGMAAIGIWAFFHSTRKFKYLIYAIPLGVALLAFAPERWSERMDTIATANQDDSFMGRVIAWKQSTLIALDHPVFGGGFHAVQDFAVWTTYRLTRFQSLDFIPTAEPDPTTAHASHSIYFQVLGDLGFLGLILFLLLGLTAWKNTAWIVKKTKGSNNLEWAGQFAQYAQYSLIAYFISGAALNLAYFEFVYILFAVLATLRQLVEREMHQKVENPSLRSDRE